MNNYQDRASIYIIRIDFITRMNQRAHLSILQKKMFKKSSKIQPVIIWIL